jgi:hypothetical protein
LTFVDYAVTHAMIRKLQAFLFSVFVLHSTRKELKMSFIFLKFSIYLSCSFLLFINLHSYVFSDKFVVKIENGKIIGETLANYYAFRGIPYATAERFLNAQKFSEKWRFVKGFKDYGKVCG